jgi:hypothetical protein
MSILKVAYEEGRSDNLQDGGRYHEREQFLADGTGNDTQETIYLLT